MHELSIAMNIVEIVEQKAKNENCTSVKEVELEVGELSGVVYDALEFALDAAKKASLLENATFTIHKISAVARCMECSHSFQTDDCYSVCPRCGNFKTELIKGKELRVKTITV